MAYLRTELELSSRDNGLQLIHGGNKGQGLCPRGSRGSPTCAFTCSVHLHRTGAATAHAPLGKSQAPQGEEGSQHVGQQ